MKHAMSVKIIIYQIHVINVEMGCVNRQSAVGNFPINIILTTYFAMAVSQI